MKKSIVIAIFSFASILMTFSCSNGNEEKNEEIVQAKNPVQKTEKMLNFEHSLKEWFQSRRESSNDPLARKASNEANLAIENSSLELLNEIGVAPTEIESKSKNEYYDNQLVSFTLKEYSKKLSELYNQNNQ